MQQLGRDLQQVYLRFKKVETMAGAPARDGASPNPALAAWQPQQTINTSSSSNRDMVTVLNSLRRDLGGICQELESRNSATGASAAYNF